MQTYYNEAFNYKDGTASARSCWVGECSTMHSWAYKLREWQNWRVYSASSALLCWKKGLSQNIQQARKLPPDYALSGINCTVCPLIHLWTLRLENKHSYFKKTIRFVQNFRNITKICAEKHQLLQAYYSAASLLFGPVMNLTRDIPFHIDICTVSINSVIKKHPFLTNRTATEVADATVLQNIK